MTNWQMVLNGILDKTISEETHSAELHIPFANPRNRGEVIRQIIHLTEAQFIKENGSLFLTFIPEKITYYSCAYRTIYSPIELYITDKAKNKKTLVDEYSIFFIPTNQSNDGMIRFTNLSLRLHGYISPLSSQEWEGLLPQEMDENASNFDNSRTDTGLIGLIKKIELNIKI